MHNRVPMIRHFKGPLVLSMSYSDVNLGNLRCKHNAARITQNPCVHIVD